jgi:Methyltransferase domain
MNAKAEAEEFFRRYPKYESLRQLIPAEAIASALVPRVKIFEALMKEARLRIPSVNIADIFGQQAEQNEIVLRRFFGHFGNVSVEEIAKIALIVRALRPERVLEIGTLNGMTTLQIAINAPASCKIFTLDLPDNVSPVVVHDVLDDYLVRFAPSKFGTAVGSYFRDIEDVKIEQLRGDSVNFDYAAILDRPLDLVHIDGGHNYETVKADSENAFRYLAPRGVVIWHNYGDVVYPDVTRYLLELSSSRKLFHLRNTLLALCRTE